VISGIGSSAHDDLVLATREAAKAALEACEKPKLALLLITYTHPPEGIPAAIEALEALCPPGTIVAGGTINGLSHGNLRRHAMLAEKAVAVIAMGGDDAPVHAVLEPFPSVDTAGEAGRRMAREVKARFDTAPAGAMIFTPGLSAGERMVDQPMLDGIHEVLPDMRVAGTGLSGGLAPNGNALPGFAFLGGRVERLGTLLVAVGGSVKSGVAMANGMQGIGLAATVTKSEGPLLRSLDGKPALDVVAQVLTTDPEKERALLVKAASVYCIEQNRSLAEWDEENGFFWPHVPFGFLGDGAMVDMFEAREGSTLSVVKLDPPLCIDAIGEAAKILGEETGRPSFDLTVAFSCCVRCFTLGPDILDEDRALASAVDSKAMIGILANGEIGCRKNDHARSTAYAFVLFALAS
jgi:hypothetical protein